MRFSHGCIQKRGFAWSLYILILNLTKHHCILLELATLIYTPRVGHRILAFLEFLPTINSTKVSHFLANNGYKVESYFLFLISPVLSLSISSLTCCGLLSFAPLSDLANLPLVLIKFTQVHTDLHPVFFIFPLFQASPHYPYKWDCPMETIYCSPVLYICKDSSILKFGWLCFWHLKSVFP